MAEKLKRRTNHLAPLADETSWLAAPFRCSSHMGEDMPMKFALFRCAECAKIAPVAPYSPMKVPNLVGQGAADAIL